MKLKIHSKVKKTAKQKQIDKDKREYKKYKNSNYSDMADYRIKSANVDFKILTYGMIRDTDVKNIRVEDETIEIKNSWNELVMYLLDTVIELYPDNYKRILIENNILNQHFIVDSTYRSGHIETIKYKLFDRDIYVESTWDIPVIYNCLWNLSKILGIEKEGIIFYIVNKYDDAITIEEFNKSGNKTTKRKRKKKDDTDKNKEVSNSGIIVETRKILEYSIDELHELLIKKNSIDKSKYNSLVLRSLIINIEGDKLNIDITDRGNVEVIIFVMTVKYLYNIIDAELLEYFNTDTWVMRKSKFEEIMEESIDCSSLIVKPNDDSDDPLLYYTDTSIDSIFTYLKQLEYKLIQNNIIKNNFVFMVEDLSDNKVSLEEMYQQRKKQEYKGDYFN